MSSIDKLKALNIHYRNTYGHQTWQKGDLPWEVLTRKIA